MDAIYLDLGNVDREIEEDAARYEADDDVDQQSDEHPLEETDTADCPVAESSSSLEDSSQSSPQYSQYYSHSLDPLDAFSGGQIATRALTMDTGRSRLQRREESSQDSWDEFTQEPLMRMERTESVESAASSSSSQAGSLVEERSGAMMAKHLDTFSGAFTSDNYQYASAYVGSGRRRRDNGPGMLDRVSGFVTGLGRSAAHTDRLAHSSRDDMAQHDGVRDVVMSHGESTAASSQQQQREPAAKADWAGDTVLSSDSSVASNQSASSEKFVVYGTDLDDPHLSSSPMSNLPSNCKAVGVIGRDFDEPQAVVKQLAHGLSTGEVPWSEVYFQPMVIPSKDLNRTNCSQFLNQGHFHMLLMCYNTTETRLMLTSATGGYYKFVLPYAQRLYGRNKVMFVLTRCKTADADVVHPALEDRLQAQPLMKEMFEQRLVLSFAERASKTQQQHILSVINAPTEQMDQECVIL